MKIVIDTNIIFSGLLSPNGTISDLLLNSSNTFDFYSPTYLLDELENHKKKLLKISGLSEKELGFLQRHLSKKIDLIDLESIRESTWETAIELTNHVDEFDAPFIALALELDSPLWTGDKKLIKGLNKKGIDWILTTEIITEIRNEE
ncbi:PIN domain-containing protein [Subsaximicrobium wynnwilliamsii]|uniref:PIN domain-containing protein n=1 Tax=Subsaximicrobium wynnwilliamsii TaxID=291179 RepID=A0A5C6ZF81_9FLAO|nr:PIN domain-containing protein [Subsaximicrobium wynnwilliamsii]TXD82222.1 PIN domain-containing protein [Subsaximicrobium wynnwilliamsii]TXD87862.1 PIN domain-containing protein [Subsaximicrobium wynnwilliamsii]TXE01812.1 PIN domain-containing protein [Subsaximicrobium wynnwilliamsii]